MKNDEHDLEGSYKAEKDDMRTIKKEVDREDVEYNVDSDNERYERCEKNDIQK